MNIREVIDISLPIHAKMATCPGSPGVKIKSVAKAGSEASTITLGAHVGTHINAPRHVYGSGKGIEAFPLLALVGPCRVLDCTYVKKAVTVSDLENFAIEPGERILIKTLNSSRGFKSFDKNYIYLDDEAAMHLAQIRVLLLGFDYLTLKDPNSEKDLAHLVLLDTEIVVCEGLDLSQVDGGLYDLMILPLKINNLDAVPARAVLT